MFALLECVHEGAFDRLTVLNVSDNMIGDEGLEALADAIKVGRLGCWSTINAKGNKRVVEQGRRRHVERHERERAATQQPPHRRLHAPLTAHADRRVDRIRARRRSERAEKTSFVSIILALNLLRDTHFSAQPRL